MKLPPPKLPRNSKKTFSLFFIIVIVALFLYWLKCQNAIDIFPAFKWESFLPLQSLQRKVPVLDPDKTPILIRESFNRGNMPQWFRLWSRSKKARVQISEDGFDGSKGIVIELKEEGDIWSFQYDPAIQVVEGQEFQYHCMAKVPAEAEVRGEIVFYDSNKKTMNWHYAPMDVPADKKNEWTKIERSFSVPSGVKYIRFRVAGSGAGKIFLDNILMIKK